MDDTLTRLGLVDDEAITLDEAALEIALPDHPDTNLTPYRQLLAAIGARLEEVGSEAATPHARADALSLVLSGEFGFVGDRQSYDDPANADLIRVLDRRRGLPVSLSILYVAAARRLGWAANVLDVPGHVLVLIGEAEESVIVDPFEGGVLVRPEQLLALLAAAPSPSGKAIRHVSTMPNRAILMRLLLNQAGRAAQAGKGRRALELYRRITAFAPDYGHAWWERARLELVDRDIAEARRSLTAMLEVTRSPELRATVTEMLGALVSP